MTAIKPDAPSAVYLYSGEPLHGKTFKWGLWGAGLEVIALSGIGFWKSEFTRPRVGVLAAGAGLSQPTRERRSHSSPAARSRRWCLVHQEIPIHEVTELDPGS